MTEIQFPTVRLPDSFRTSELESLVAHWDTNDLIVHGILRLKTNKQEKVQIFTDSTDTLTVTWPTRDGEEPVAVYRFQDNEWRKQ
jgi:hypothetical protein